MYRNYIKRILDIGVAIVVLIFSLPAWVIIAVIIKLESEGPVLFVQERTGVKGKGLSSYVSKIFEEFREEFEKFGSKKYDILEPKSNVNFKKNILFNSIILIIRIFQMIILNSIDSFKI